MPASNSTNNVNNQDKQQDKRPGPKPRKHPRLYQAYQWWNELMEMRMRHNLRISAIGRGDSNLDAQFERDQMDAILFYDVEVKYKTVPAKIKRVSAVDEMRKIMIKHGEDVGPIWEWLTSIRGLKAGGEAAKLAAMIDDIGNFATISKLWRFAGWAVIEGNIDRCQKGVKSPYNRKLKSCVFLIVDGFIKHRTPVYRDYYDEQRARESRLHPYPICTKCGGRGVQVGQNWKCSDCGQGATGQGLKYTPAHLNKRAIRKVAKLFLSHLWVKWREFEGLTVSEPYVQAVMGHTNIIPPP